MNKLALVVAVLCVVTTAPIQAQTNSRSIPTLDVIRAVAPVFPKVAVAGRVSGSAVVEVAVNADGKVTSVNVNSGDPVFHRIVKDAAARWQLAPAKNEDVRNVRLTFEFNYVWMSNGKFSAEELTPVFVPPYKGEVTQDTSESRW